VTSSDRMMLKDAQFAKSDFNSLQNTSRRNQTKTTVTDPIAAASRRVTSLRHTTAGAFAIKCLCCRTIGDAAACARSVDIVQRRRDFSQNRKTRFQVDRYQIINPKLFEDQPMKALLAGVSTALVLLAGTAALHADAKYVKLRVVNKFDFA